MCIDTLHISFRDRGNRSLTLRQREEVEPDPRHPDFQGVQEGIAQLGYEMDEVQEWNSNGIPQYKLFVHGSQGQRNAMMVRGAAYSNNYMRVVKIECNPSSFGTYPEFRRLLQTINARSHSDIFRYGNVVRIDYTLDYRLPFYPFVTGLYYDYAQTVLAYADVNDPFEEYHWDSGIFRSLRIGKDRKVIKLYDKGYQDWKSQTLDELRRRREHPESRSQIIPALQPRSRIEVSLTQRHVIRAFWGENYNGTLEELDRHLQDMASGNRSPFKAILMNKITTRQSQALGFEVVNNLGNQRLRNEIESGFLNVVYRRMRQQEQDFWDETRNVCAIMPWHETFQPHSVYRSRLQQWLGMYIGYDPRGKTMPERRYWSDRLQTGPWPMHLAGIVRPTQNTEAIIPRPRVLPRNAD
ncbi:MAG: hypothetical protein KJ017_09905 [Alphaproteobacteria bacterium]|nr:hypothetical protein [Alphaproteobacteria bacterium]